MIKLLVIFLILLASPISVNAEVIYEDDFNSNTTGWESNDPGGGHNIQGGTLGSPGLQTPPDWTGHIYYDAAQILDIPATAGRSGTPGFRVGPKIGSGQFDQVGLTIWLGETGYEELYIRYFVKLEDNFLFGDPSNSTGGWAMWKHGRVWQNVTADNLVNTNMASELNRGAIVWGYYNDNYLDHNPYVQTLFMKDATAGTNDCSSEECGKMYYYPYVSGNDQGFVTQMTGALNGTNHIPTEQDWHCIELHYKLASDWESEDGEYDLWIDGIKQVTPTRLVDLDGVPTAKIGTGMNYITLHDNGSMTSYWEEQYHIYYDDVVISTSYVGPDYVIGGSAVNAHCTLNGTAPCLTNGTAHIAIQ